MLDQIRLEQLEFARLALDPLLRLLVRKPAILDDEASDAPEVDRHESCHEPLHRLIAEARENEKVVDDAGPQIVGEVEARDRVGKLVRGGQPGAGSGALVRLAVQTELVGRGLGEGPGLLGEGQDAPGVVGLEHALPRPGEGQRAGVEQAEQPQGVDFERGRLGVPLEAVGRNVVAAGDLQPAVGVAAGHSEERPEDLAKHRSQVRARVLGIVDLGPEAALADRESAGQGGRSHPDVDAEARHVRRPALLGEVVADQVGAHAEVAPDRLADAAAVQRPRHRVGEGVGDGAVVLVAGVERGHEVVAALEDRPGEQLDPLGDDRAQVRVDDHQRLDLERRGHLEERPQGGSLAADAVDLGVGQADPGQTVLGVDEQDLLDVAGRLRFHDHTLRSVGGAGVRVHQDGAQVGEVLDQTRLCGPDDVADGGRVPVARNADHDDDRTEPGDLIPNGRCQRTRGHLHHPTTAARRGTRPSGTGSTRRPSRSARRSGDSGRWRVCRPAPESRGRAR